MRSLPDDVALLCAASDGVDGSSGVGGAGVTRSAAAGVTDEAIDQALVDFDDARIHRALGTQLQGGPTGHNLADVHILARARR
jgi:hydroxypyruvate reductase